MIFKLSWTFCFTPCAPGIVIVLFGRFSSAKTDSVESTTTVERA
jgi:hypothetical protein